MRIGYALPIGERGDPPKAVRYSEIRELAIRAEAAGLDSLWAADHIFHEPPAGPRRGLWENWTIFSALAEATQRVEFGPLVLCMPFRNPGMVGWQANTLDEVSNGRFVLGLGAGWHKPEFDAFNFEFEHRVSFFEDALNVNGPLLREGRVDYDGEFASGHTTRAPRGPREKGPPLMIAAFKPRMFRLAAQWADRYNTVWYGLPNGEFEEHVTNLRAACEKIGRDPEEIEVSAGLTVLDEKQARTREPGNWLHLDANELADAFAVWSEKGVSEVMCRPEAASPQSVEVIARAAESFRAG
jgi:alkanesulfonate monooxygenase SsuD/methylene tetrahydromethanopterin reductase-like flavin-dependent oxidoreductase (luciferase family)